MSGMVLFQPGRVGVGLLAGVLPHNPLIGQAHERFARTLRDQNLAPEMDDGYRFFGQNSKTWEGIAIPDICRPRHCLPRDGCPNQRDNFHPSFRQILCSNIAPIDGYIRIPMTLL